VILDEPTVGLDPAQIVEIRGMIKSLAPTHTVIFSSHILSEVSEICSRILIISDGRLIAEDTPENLESHFVATPVLSVSIKGDPEAVLAAIDSLSGVTDVQITEGENGVTDAVLTCEKGVDIKEALALAMLQNGCLIVRLEESRASLEDVFMELVSQQPELPAAADAADDEPLEVDAQALLDGSVESAYDAHEAFDAPKDDADEEPAEEPDEEPAEAPDAETAEGGEDDAGNV
jgi:ABC-2 type transport system ATP-binding protein